MAIQYLTAEDQGSQYYFKVWMDNTKTLEDGSPDPVYTTEFEWVKTPPVGVTDSDYLANIKTEIDLLVAVQLNAMSGQTTTATPLAGFTTDTLPATP